jgi:hypothetical protein
MSNVSGTGGSKDHIQIEGTYVVQNPNAETLTGKTKEVVQKALNPKSIEVTCISEKGTDPSRFKVIADGKYYTATASKTENFIQTPKLGQFTFSCVETPPAPVQEAPVQEAPVQEAQAPDKVYITSKTIFKNLIPAFTPTYEKSSIQSLIQKHLCTSFSYLMTFDAKIQVTKTKENAINDVRPDSTPTYYTISVQSKSQQNMIFLLTETKQETGSNKFEISTYPFRANLSDGKILSNPENQTKLSEEERALLGFEPSIEQPEVKRPEVKQPEVKQPEVEQPNIQSSVDSVLESSVKPGTSSMQHPALREKGPLKRLYLKILKMFPDSRNTVIATSIMKQVKETTQTLAANSSELQIGLITYQSAKDHGIYGKQLESIKSIILESSLSSAQMKAYETLSPIQKSLFIDKLSEDALSHKINLDEKIDPLITSSQKETVPQSYTKSSDLKQTVDSILKDSIKTRTSSIKHPTSRAKGLLKRICLQILKMFPDSRNTVIATSIMKQINETAEALSSNTSPSKLQIGLIAYQSAKDHGISGGQLGAIKNIILKSTLSSKQMTDYENLSPIQKSLFLDILLGDKFLPKKSPDEKVDPLITALKKGELAQKQFALKDQVIIELMHINPELVESLEPLLAEQLPNPLGYLYNQLSKEKQKLFYSLAGNLLAAHTAALKKAKAEHTEDNPNSTFSANSFKLKKILKTFMNTIDTLPEPLTDEEHTAALKKAEAEHTEALKEAKAEHTAALKKAEAEHTEALKEAKAEHTAALKKAKAEHTAAFFLTLAKQEANQAYSKHTEDLKKAHEKRIEDLAQGNNASNPSKVALALLNRFYPQNTQDPKSVENTEGSAFSLLAKRASL